jgi:hypothetical protein
VEAARLLNALLDLAREVELPVKTLGRASGADAPAQTSSGVCRVRGEFWVLLIDADPPERRVEVLAGALREHASEQLEQRYLPPALRAILED